MLDHECETKLKPDMYMKYIYCEITCESLLLPNKEVVFKTKVKKTNETVYLKKGFIYK